MSSQCSQRSATLGERALGVLLSKLGERETPGRKNQGPVVEWACKRWLREEEFSKLYAAGALQWCAGAVCSAYHDAGSSLLSPDARPRVASLSCGTLLERLARIASLDEGLPLGRVRAVVLRPEEELFPGDLVFTDRDRDGKPNHVGLLFEAQLDGDGLLKAVVTVSGNSGESATEVAKSRPIQVESGRLLAFVRVLR